MMVEEEFTENLSNFSSIEKKGGMFLRYFIERIQYFISRPGSCKQYQNTFLPPHLSESVCFSPRSAHPIVSLERLATEK